MFTSIRLKIREFFKTRKKLFLGILIVVAIIIIINIVLKGVNERTELPTSYEKHESVMNSKLEVPQKLKTPIEEFIDTYFNYCKNKEYENAYSLLSDGCKENCFKTIEDFKVYIDLVFKENQIYYIQNYSNYDTYYIYRMRILDDILKTGMTGMDDLSYYEEKLAIQKVGDSFKLGIRQYITTDKFDTVYEDEYLKIWIEKRDVFYEQEKYLVKIKNKSQYIAVLADGTEHSEVLALVNSNTREALENNLQVILQDAETMEYEFSFTRFFDESSRTNKIIFNNVRILKSYSGLDYTREQELQDAEKLYSIEVEF